MTGMNDASDLRLRVSELEEENARLQMAQVGHLRILESLEVINRIIIGATDPDKMLTQGLEQFLKFFSCDRAWLLYPCDPGADTFRVPIERTRPQWPGAGTEDVDVPHNDFSHGVMELAINAPGTVRFDPEENTLNPDEEINIQFHIRSQLVMAIRPRIGKPWLLGIHHCAAPVIYSRNDRNLFEALGNRLADGLSSLLSWKDTKRLFENAEVSIWNVDLSDVRNALDELRRDGVKNLRRHLEDGIQAAWHIATRAKVIHVNEATLTLFGAETEDDFVYAIDRIYGQDTIDFFIDGLCAIWDERKVFRSEAAFRTLDGKDIETIVSFRIPQTEEGFQSIPVSIIDITERKQAEAALRNAHENLERIVKERTKELEFQKRALDEHAIVSIADTKGTIIYTNDKFCEISGYSREELLGQNHRIASSGLHSREFFADMWRTIVNGKVWRGNIRNCKKDGEYYWVDATIVPFLNDQGIPFQYVAIRTDITERIDAEEELIKSQTQFEVMAEATQNMMTIVRLSDGVVVYCNSSVKHILGITSAEIVGTDAADYYADKTVRTDLLRRLKEDDRLRNLEVQLLRADGSTIWVSLNIQLAQLEGETYLFSEIIDISDKKFAEQQLELSEQRFRDFSETASDWTWETDADHKVSFLSGKFFEQEGFTNNYFMGKTRQDFIGERNIALDPKKWVRHQEGLDNHHPFNNFEYPIHDETGKRRQFQISGKPIFGADGKFSGFRGTGIDITEKKEMEEVLNRAKEEAETASQAKSEFLSSMSHELRTPMNSILGFAQMLGFNPNEPLTETQKTSVDHILNGGQHLLELINEILDLARIEAGKIGLSIEDISPTRILDECLTLTTTMADQHGIDISVHDAAMEGSIIRADHTRFKQVLLNLMSNAVKYNREDGTVTITFKETADNMLHIAITDTGEGITKDKQAELFKPFSRLGAENTEIEGTGIGLVVCKNLIEAMNGAIGLESEVGKGSTFWIELPLSNSDHDEVDAIIYSEAAQDEGKLPYVGGSLLYVEDNPANLQLMELIINRFEGFSMISAHTGEQGIELAKSEKPDLIILDINLPGMDGFEVLQELRSYNNTMNIPVIALSANAMSKDIEKGIEAGFKLYLTKPIKVEEVTDVIRNTMEASE